MTKKYIYMVSVSELGSRMNFMAISALILTFENPALYLTAFFLARQIAGIATSLLAGVVADRFKRRNLMLTSELSSAVAVLMPACFPNPIAVTASAFILGCTYQIFYISYSAAIPDMFGENNAHSINQLIVRLSSAAGIIGFLSGGVIAEFVGIVPVILLDSFTFLAGALFLRFLNWEEARPEKEGEPFKEHDRDWKISSKLNSMPSVIIITGLFYSFVVACYNFSLPFLADSLPRTSIMNGVFWSAIAGGMMAGSLSKKGGTDARVYFTFLFFFAILISGAFFLTSFWLILPALFLAGIFEGKTQAAGNTILQQVPHGIRGRAFGFYGLSSRAGYLAGFLIAPAVAVSKGIEVLVSCGAIFLLLAIFFLSLQKPVTE